MLNFIKYRPHVTEATFSRFKESLLELVDLGFRIAEILPTRDYIVTEPEKSHGVVNKFNMTAQFLYELQGEVYLNLDAFANFSKVKIQTPSNPTA
jgi:hypothetical protein